MKVSNHILFARKYHAQGRCNGADAYILVYGCDNRKTAKVNASRLLKHKTVQIELARLAGLSKLATFQEGDVTAEQKQVMAISKNELLQDVNKTINISLQEAESLLDTHKRKLLLAEIAVYGNQEVTKYTKSGEPYQEKRNPKDTMSAVDLINKMEGQYSDTNININNKNIVITDLPAMQNWLKNNTNKMKII